MSDSYKTYSRFGRDPQVYLYLVDAVLYTLARRAVACGEKKIRIWSVGCAGGEEPYSLAIAWHCALAEFFPSIQLEILATDVDTNAIERAAQATYTAHTIANLPIEWVAKCFDVHTHTNGQAMYILRPAIKSCLQFEQADVRKEIPFQKGPFSLLICRYSVFLYLSSDEAATFLRQATLPGFFKESGYLVTGLSDRLPQGSIRFCNLEEVRCDEISDQADILSIASGSVPNGIYRKNTKAVPLNDGMPSFLTTLLARRRRKTRALQPESMPRSNIAMQSASPIVTDTTTKSPTLTNRKTKSKKNISFHFDTKKKIQRTSSDPTLFKPRIPFKPERIAKLKRQVTIVPTTCSFSSTSQINIKLPRVATLPPRKLMQQECQNQDNIKPLRPEEMKQLIARIAKPPEHPSINTGSVPEENDEIDTNGRKLSVLDAQNLVERLMADAVRREQEMTEIMNHLQRADVTSGPTKLSSEQISSFLQRMDADARHRHNTLRQAQSRLSEVESHEIRNSSTCRRAEFAGIDGLHRLAAFRHEHFVQLIVRPTDLVQFMLKKPQSRWHFPKSIQPRVKHGPSSSAQLSSTFAKLQQEISQITSPRSFVSNLASLDEISEVKKKIELGTAMLGEAFDAHIMS